MDGSLFLALALSHTFSICLFAFPPLFFCTLHFFAFAQRCSAIVRIGLIHAKMKSIETQNILK